MRRAAPWLAAALGLAITLMAFWPGYLSWDSAYQWFQARSGQLDPAHPPVMVRVWQLARLVLPDPGGMLLLQATLWWGALGLLADALGGDGWRRAATVLLVGLWPPLLALLPHLWKDVWMAGFFALAVACLAQEVRDGGARWRVGALAAVAAGCAFRLNALPAALPLLAWLAWRQWPAHRGRALAGLAGLLVVVQLAATAANFAPGTRRTPVWPIIALWDIAAVSIAEDRLLFPPDWVADDLTVEELRRDFSPYVNVPSFDSGKVHLNFYYDYTPEQYAQLRAVWLSLPVEHARAYWAHRAELMAYLLGRRQDQHPDYLVISPGVVAFRDNPPVEVNSGPVHAFLQPRLDALVDAPVFAPWPYLLLSLGVLPFAWRRRRETPRHGLAIATALSGLCLALPLVVVAPSSDFRYLGWSVMAAGLAIFLQWWRRD